MLLFQRQVRTQSDVWLAKIRKQIEVCEGNLKSPELDERDKTSLEANLRRLGDEIRPFKELIVLTRGKKWIGGSSANGQNPGAWIRKAGIMATPHTQHEITCPHCHAPLVVHIEHIRGASSPPLETAICPNTKCKHEFEMPFPGRIVGGPFLV
jgi:hypothetical protein